MIKMGKYVLISSLMIGIVGCSSPSNEPAAPGAAAAPAKSSSAGLPQGRIDAGEKLASTAGKATGQSCVDCHGQEGNAPLDPVYPKLGGQFEDYIAHALKAYRAGDRDHVLMRPQAADLSDQDIADLSAYFASRPSQLHDLTNAIK